MPTSEARVTTDRASRYLVQLCRHLGEMGRMRHRSLLHHGGGKGMPPEVQQVDCTDTHGTVRFPGGIWALEATADALIVRVEAQDEDTLLRLQAGIASRLEKIGRRDGLSVIWQRKGDFEGSNGLLVSPVQSDRRPPDCPPAPGTCRASGWRG